MRLPSYTQQDERELIRDLSSALDGPEVLMDAMEYLQNQHSSTSSSSMNGTLPKGDSTAPSWTESYPPSQHGRQDYPRRYISYPWKGPDGSGDDSSIATAEESLRKYVGNVKLDLPVDEDDYLMPSPQNNKNATTYLHIVGDPRMQGLDQNGQPMQNKPRQYPILVDNPEYQLTAREYTNVPLAYAPIGLPPCTNSLNANPNLSHLHNQNQSLGQYPGEKAQSHYRHHQPPSSSRRHGSRSEEESDHEYYNELDRLKREKQPLQVRKNETTV
jgi:L1 cell adhesion molecule